MIIFFLLCIAYGLGSIPVGFLVAKSIKGIDIRKWGSRSTGATNVGRVVGKKWGLLVFFLDVIKGAAAVQFSFMMAQSGGFQDDKPALLAGLAGVFAILGHSFPVWLKGKGGKGVATSLGVFTALLPFPALLTFALWIIVFLAGRRISLASLVAAAVFPVSILGVQPESSMKPVWLGFGLFLAFFIFYTHRENIGRLLRGEEKKYF